MNMALTYLCLADRDMSGPISHQIATDLFL